jgi:DNA polymerase phi
MMQVLACFWDLAAIESERRAEAASKLLDHLLKSQEQYINVANPAKASTGENASAALDFAVGSCSPLVAYSIRRLHKGLTSGRKGARQGFALALTAILGNLNCFKPENVLSLVESLNDLSVGGGRDEFFGQLFGLGAIVRAQELDEPTAVAVIEQAVALAHKKSFLREAAATLITELAEKNPVCMARVLDSSSSGSSGQLRAWLTAPCDQVCPEALALALRLWQYMPKELIKACHVLPSNCTSVPSSNLFTQDEQKNSNSTIKNKKNNSSNNDLAVAAAFFSEAHLKKIQPVLHATTQGHPRLHIVWPTLVSLLLKAASSNNNEDVSKMVDFWNILVETDIFQSASHERKYLGFILFGEILPNIQIELICKLLTPNFMHSLATNVSKKDSVLHPVAQQCVQQLGAVVRKANASARAEILHIVERHGNGYLLKLLNSQKIDDMQPSDADVAARVKELKEEFDTLVKDEESSVGRQKSVLGQLAGIAKRQQRGASVVKDILEFLVDKGLFKVRANKSFLVCSLFFHSHFFIQPFLCFQIFTSAVW